ncbi:MULTISPECIES: hypothetical protein [unclassified Lentimonas]|uniref:hypothetical protein n=1 Tax=unclassified Lentimonas TaxID=2630993 RepID=UPI0013288AFA|nr:MULTISPECIES: hypothetical protein [unclassified Lentimonas]CAA6694234.1 Unannotated [Lentimonas sp. CC10]CAA6694273.1 Unannotated [Lentimonas sp. CC19]CAA7071060.1 Unannotated [Lentimonas sp. CC11]
MHKTIFIVIPLAALVFSLFIGRDLANQHLLHDWGETVAMNPQPHVESRLGSNNSRQYMTCISYEYSVQEVQYTERECGIFNHVNLESTADALIQGYLEREAPKGLIARYRMDDPAVAYLVCEQKEARSLKAFYISVGVLILSVAYLIAKYRIDRQ